MWLACVLGHQISYTYKKKVKVTLLSASWMHVGGSSVLAPLIHNLCTRLRWLANLPTACRFAPRKEAQYPLNRRQEKKNMSYRYRDLNPGPFSTSPGRYTDWTIPGRLSFVESSTCRFVSCVIRRLNRLTLRRLMSYIYIYIYIYGAPILDVSRSHTTTQHSR